MGDGQPRLLDQVRDGILFPEYRATAHRHIIKRRTKVLCGLWTIERNVEHYVFNVPLCSL
jgi:hypothetical protein